VISATTGSAADSVPPLLTLGGGDPWGTKGSRSRHGAAWRRVPVPVARRAVN